MKPARGEALPRPAHPVARILAVDSAGRGLPVARNLARLGHDVATVTTVADLKSRIESGPCDAVLVDLTGAPPAGALLEEVASLLAASRSDPDATPPAVVALGTGGDAAPGVRFEPDAWIGAGDAARAAAEAEAAITSLRLTRAAEEIERLRGAVRHARRTAHELAQPLTTILARAQLLLAKVEADDPRHRMVSIINGEADRLAKLVLEFQKLREMVRPQPAERD